MMTEEQRVSAATAILLGYECCKFLGESIWRWLDESDPFSSDQKPIWLSDGYTVWAGTLEYPYQEQGSHPKYWQPKISGVAPPPPKNNA